MTDRVLSFTREGSGPDVVLFHGGVGSRNHWDRNLPALTPLFTVTAVDLPGFGSSPSVEKDIPPAAYVARVAEAIGDLGLPKFRLVAFSFGGVVAAGVAAAMREQIVSLTLVAPGGFGIPDGRKLDLKSVPPEGMRSPAGREALRHNLGITMFSDEDTADEATVEKHLLNIEHARFDSRRVSFEDRLTRDLKGTMFPLQTIWGTRDKMAYPSIDVRFDRIKSVRPDARLDLIPGGGHWIQHEKPEAFNEALLSFIHPAAQNASNRKIS